MGSPLLLPVHGFSKDYEYLPTTSEALLYAAMIHRMVRRLARGGQASVEAGRRPRQLSLPFPSLERATRLEGLFRHPLIATLANLAEVSVLRAQPETRPWSPSDMGGGRGRVLNYRAWAFVAAELGLLVQPNTATTKALSRLSVGEGIVVKTKFGGQ